MDIFDYPGARSRIIKSLDRLSFSLTRYSDPDQYFRYSDEGWQFEDRHVRQEYFTDTGSSGRQFEDLPGDIDDVLAFLIRAIVVSANDFKADSRKWWEKCVRLAKHIGLTMQDEGYNTSSGGATAESECASMPHAMVRRQLIAREERRRLFWLIYALDRHLALSHNRRLSIPDGSFRVLAPLPEEVWSMLPSIDLRCLLSQQRSFDVPLRVTGTGLFEYFLPLASLLGYVIEFHHHQLHPILGNYGRKASQECLDDMLSKFEHDLSSLKSLQPSQRECGPYYNISNDEHFHFSLVVAYSTYILHTLFILLHGKWDPICMIEDEEGWITSTSFLKCSSHAILAYETLSEILELDRELVFMPYLFGIYLFHGSVVILLFADRMPILGRNDLVTHLCETIIRAHEVCVVTLDTTFQKNFRRVLRSMLYESQGLDVELCNQNRARRRELLALYRWTPFASGLAC